MSNRIVIAVVLTVIFATAVADPVTECRARYAASPEEHIACLEAALAARDGSPVADVDVSEAGPKPQTTPESQTDPELHASPERQVASEFQAGTEPDLTPAPVSGLGAEQVRERQPPDESRPDEVVVHILSATYNARGLGTFRMADGQVWRETTASPERRRLKSDRQYQARIKRGVVGGYRMYVDGVRWMMTVERIE